MIERFEIPTWNKEELDSKLSSVRYPQELEDNTNANWKLGTPTWAVQELANIWKTRFDWEAQRQKLNQWHHYRTKIQDLNIHFVHEISPAENAVPILLLHGWPSTFYEFHKMIEPLRDGAQPFHVIIPSLPGYGFSDAPTKDGCDVNQIAAIFHELMTKLGYDKYMIYGTDWGSIIGRQMSVSYPSSMGFISNMPMGAPPLPTIQNLIYHPLQVLLFIVAIFVGFDKIYGSKGLDSFAFANVDKDESAGYRAIQSTRPYTLSFGLTDSPVGLLSWMLEAYHGWSYFPSVEAAQTSILPPGISTDEFLTQVTIYWITNTMSSSMRIYYETKKEKMKKMSQSNKIYQKAPVAASYFAAELVKFPREWLAIKGNLVQFEEHDIGGHFPGLEATELLIKDIQKFRSKLLPKNTASKKTN